MSGYTSSAAAGLTSRTPVSTVPPFTIESDQPAASTSGSITGDPTVHDVTGESHAIYL